MIHRTGKKKPSREPMPNIDSLGAGKGWRRSWRVLVDALRATSQDEFSVVAPRIKRALKDFSVWMSQLKQDPRGLPNGPRRRALDVVFRDEELGAAFRVLAGLAVRLKMGVTESCPEQLELARSLDSLIGLAAHSPSSHQRK